MLILFAVGLMVLAIALNEVLQDDLRDAESVDEAQDISDRLEAADKLWESGVILSAVCAGALALNTARIVSPR